MAQLVSSTVSIARGAVLHALASVSTSADARENLQTLRDALTAAAPDYAGLETIFDQHLIRHAFTSDQARASIQDHLRRHWFDPASPERFFPDHDVARIYAEGVIKAIDLALSHPEIAPIEGWWVLDVGEVRLASLVHQDDPAGPVRDHVTLLVQTPRPAAAGPVSQTPILGATPEAWVTSVRDDALATRPTRTSA